MYDHYLLDESDFNSLRYEMVNNCHHYNRLQRKYGEEGSIARLKYLYYIKGMLNALRELKIAAECRMDRNKYFTEFVLDGDEFPIETGEEDG